MIIAGVDLSLTGTGLIVLNDGKVTRQELIKTKPTKSAKEEVLRLRRIVDQLLVVIKDECPNVVIIEGMAFMARNTTALVQLAGLNYLLRDELVKLGIPFVIVAPTSLKKFITGAGNTSKDQIMLHVFKKWDVTLLNDNLADAFGLAKCGEALIGKVGKLTQPEAEVIKLLQPQWINRDL